MSDVFTLEDLDRVRRAIECEIPTLMRDNDGEFYILWISDLFVGDAFEMGLMPFCPLLGGLRGQYGARYPK